MLESKYYRKKDLTAMLSISTATLDRWVKDRIFPQPQKIRGIAIWPQSTIQQWSNNLQSQNKK